jgi:hypothetical protein
MRAEHAYLGFTEQHTDARTASRRAGRKPRSERGREVR